VNIKWILRARFKIVGVSVGIFLLHVNTGISKRYNGNKTDCAVETKKDHKQRFQVLMSACVNMAVFWGFELCSRKKVMIY
jgi:hypothetical protein